MVGGLVYDQLEKIFEEVGCGIVETQPRISVEGLKKTTVI
jgi:hypothetical protein